MPSAVTSPTAKAELVSCEHQPPLRHRLHPGAAEGDELADDEEPEVRGGGARRRRMERARGKVSGGSSDASERRVTVPDRRLRFAQADTVRTAYPPSGSTAHRSRVIAYSMRFTTYSKFHPELADAVNLQALLDQLSDFLLQSGFAGGSPSFWHDEMGDGRALAGRAAPGHPPGADGLGPAHAGDAQGAPGRVRPATPSGTRRSSGSWASCSTRSSSG